MPDMQIILTNELSNIAAQTSLSLEGLVSSMKNSGMSNEAIKQTLVNDLTSGGRLFGNFRNQIKNTVKNCVEMSGNNGSMGTFEDAGVNGPSNIRTTVNLGACFKYDSAVCDVKY